VQMDDITVKTEVEDAPVGDTSVVLDGSPRGGEDDMMEGTEIKTSNFADWSESDSDEEMHHCGNIDSRLICDKYRMKMTIYNFRRARRPWNRYSGAMKRVLLT
jgi:hypothetical protein